MPFESPNYTQAPNDLFDTHLRGLGEAELKVILVVIRHTFGYHREEFVLSSRKMADITGLSLHGVMDGAKAAEEHGFIERVTVGRKSTTWRACVSVALGDTTLSRSGIQPVALGDTQAGGLNKDIKKIIKEKESLPTPFTIYRELAHYQVPVALKEEVQATVTDLQLWHDVIYNWIGLGWKPTNVKGMLEAYRKGGIPSKNGKQQANEPTGYAGIRAFMEEQNVNSK